MSDHDNTATRKALSAEEFSALFRRNADNERLYRESEIRLDLAERMTEMQRDRRENSLCQRNATQKTRTR